MSVVGDVKSIVDGMAGVSAWWRKSKNPVRQQAQRFIDTFEQYGIERQQISRVLPEKLQIKAVDCSEADRLMGHISPQLLDWAAEYLAIQRAWFDLCDVHPHLIVDHYKCAERYGSWLDDRMLAFPEASLRSLNVYASEVPKLSWEGKGPLVLCYRETSRGLDGNDFDRYWLWSRDWSAYHLPCIENMLGAVAQAQQRDVLVLGKLVSKTELQKVSDGVTLVPTLAARSRGTWHPEDVVGPTI